MRNRPSDGRPTSPPPSADSAFYRSLVEGSAEITAVVDEQGVITYLSPAARRLLGTEAGDSIGRSFMEFVHPEDLPGVVQSFAVASREAVFEGQDEVRVRGVDGYRWMQSLGRRLTEGPAAGHFLLQLRDITARREAEERLRREERSAAFQALLLDSVGQAVVATDAEGRVLYWNRGAELLFGWTAAEAMGTNVTALVPPEAGQEDPGSIMAALRQRGSWSGEYTVRGKDGVAFPILLTNRPVVEDGEVVGFIGVGSDLRELKQLEERLRQAQKLEAVGRLAGGIAHDFNNILTAIGGYAEMASQRATDEQVASDLAEVVRATDRGRGLVNKLLAFSRRGHVSLRPLDLNRVIGELVPVLRRNLPAAVRLEMEAGAGLWPVRTDPSQIEQAVTNLVLNARDAMPDGGVVTIRTDNVTLTERMAARLQEEVGAGEYVRLVIQDTGIGMDEAVRSRIFEPFFTTKAVGEGAGLGLSTVFGAIRQLGGGIQVESRPGGGSRFSLYMPRSEVPISEEGGRLGTEAAAGAAILLVEDERAVRQLARRVLERAGYRVLEAATGREALRVVEEAEWIDLVVTDVIMPEMGGGELAERLQQTRPDLRFLFMSGYTADELSDRGIETSTTFLPKPFPPSLLVERVGEILGSRGKGSGNAP